MAEPMLAAEALGAGEVRQAPLPATLPGAAAAVVAVAELVTKGAGLAGGTGVAATAAASSTSVTTVVAATLILILWMRKRFKNFNSGSPHRALPTRRLRHRRTSTPTASCQGTFAKFATSSRNETLTSLLGIPRGLGEALPEAARTLRRLEEEMVLAAT